MRKFYKYHRKHNDKSKLFEDDLFQHAEIVLLSSGPTHRVYFIKNKKQVDVEDGKPVYEGMIGSFILKDFQVPPEAQRISPKRFFQLVGPLGYEAGGL